MAKLEPRMISSNKNSSTTKHPIILKNEGAKAGYLKDFTADLQPFSLPESRVEGTN
jgi:hypothetical protein